MDRVEAAHKRVALAEANAEKARGKLKAAQERAEAVSRLRVARAARDEAQAEYMRLLFEADKAGATVAEIVDAAGITRRTFYEWVRKGKAPTQARRG